MLAASLDPSPGIVQIRSSRSILVHLAKPDSPLRVAVRVRNRIGEDGGWVDGRGFIKSSGKRWGIKSGNQRGESAL